MSENLPLKLEKKISDEYNEYKCIFIFLLDSCLLSINKMNTLEMYEKTFEVKSKSPNEMYNHYNSLFEQNLIQIEEDIHHLCLNFNNKKKNKIYDIPQKIGENDKDLIQEYKKRINQLQKENKNLKFKFNKQNEKERVLTIKKVNDKLFINDKNIISLGINIGALKTVYSIFFLQ